MARRAWRRSRSAEVEQPRSPPARTVQAKTGGDGSRLRVASPESVDPAGPAPDQRERLVAVNATGAGGLGEGVRLLVDMWITFAGEGESVSRPGRPWII